MNNLAGNDNPAFVKNNDEEINPSNKGKPFRVIDVNYNSKSPNKFDLELKNLGSDKNKVEVEELEDDQYRCGFGCFTPEWIQGFATKRVFIIIFSLLGVIQSMSWAYFTGTITTLEKRFKINTKTAGVVMTGNEVSQIIFSIILSYYGGKGHRPRWIAVGVLFSAMACFVLASPHLFYGAGEDSLSLTEEYQDVFQRSFHNSTKHVTAGGKVKGVELCGKKEDKMAAECHNNEAFLLPLILIFMSQFVAGIGNIMFFSLGGPYLDDNTKKTNLPMVFGVTMSFRLIGPTFGFLLSAGCLQLFVNPLLTPTIRQDDVLWIGAWWLGWIILGTLMLIASGIIALFPRELRSKKNQSADLESKKTKELAKDEDEDGLVKTELMQLKEIPAALKILLKNKVYFFNNLAAVFYIFAAVGYWTFSPKYLETIFMQTASGASVISGTVGIAFQAAGLLGSGFLISRFRFRAKTLAGWNAIICFLHVAVLIVFTQIGCQVGNIEFGSQDIATSSWNLSSTCNTNCDCSATKLKPVCFEKEDKVYFSACHAGCQNITDKGILSNCSCLPTMQDTLKAGTCSEHCTLIFIIFLGVTAFVKMMDSTGRIGNMLIHYRCVDKKDRSLSIGLGLCFISIFALLPAPIVFGALIDSVCLVWNTSKCTGKGNCLFYDAESLRYVFNLTAAAFVTIGGVFDVLVWYFVGDLDLYSETTPTGKSEEGETHVKK